jgi:Putative lactococcus lactis phage r1t holin
MNKRFFYDLIERTLRTFVQGFLSVVTLDAFSKGFDPTWKQTVGMGLLAGVYAVLTAFAAKPIGGNTNSASVLNPPAGVQPVEPRP